MNGKAMPYADAYREMVDSGTLKPEIRARNIADAEKEKAPSATGEGGITAEKAQAAMQDTEMPDGIGAVALLRAHKDDLSGLPSVAKISGDEITRTGRASERLISFVNGLKETVFRKGFGEVLFSKKRIKSSTVGHGVSESKIELFASVPAVIENGKQIDYQKNWKGRGYDSYVFAAPVEYRGKSVYVACIVTKDADNRYYLHEAIDENGNILYGETEKRNVASDTPADQPPSHVADITPSNVSIPQVSEKSQEQNSAAEDRRGSLLSAARGAAAAAEMPESPEAAVYAAVSGGKVRSADADAILADAKQRAAFESVTGVQLTGDAKRDRKTVASNAKAYTEAYRAKTVKGMLDEVVKGAYQNNLRDMRSALGRFGQTIYDKIAPVGVTKVAPVRGRQISNFNAEFSAYYRQGMLGQPFSFLEGGSFHGVEEDAARAVYRAGELDARMATSISVTERSGILAGASEEQIDTCTRLGQAFDREIVLVNVADADFHGVYADGKIYINVRSTAPIVTTVAHEFVHSVQSDSDTYRALRDHVFSVLGKSEAELRAAKRRQSVLYAEKSDADIDFEIVASFIGNRVLATEDDVRAMVDAVGTERSVRLHDWLRGIANKVKAAFAGSKSKAVQSELSGIERARQLLADVVREKKNAADGAAFDVSETFENKYDQWANSRKDGVRIFVGTASEALKSIGVKEQEIYWDSSKINDSLKKHEELDDTVVKQVPYLLENPILIMESNSLDAKEKNPDSNRIVLLGEVYGKNGVPVMAVLELEPTNKKGVLLNEIKVVSTYTKVRSGYNGNEQNLKMQDLINNSKILYIEPQKSRTNAWLRRNRLQLPFGVTKFGPIGKIAYKGDFVKYYNANNGSFEFSAGNDDDFLSSVSGQDAGHTQSRQFKRWFGDWQNHPETIPSVLLNDDGTPKVFYHGTSNGGFSAFDTYGGRFGLFGRGSYFTDNPDVAAGYTKKG